MAGAGEHLRGIITGERRLSAAQLAGRLQGMRLLTVATVTADGRPLAGPVDGYFLHGTFWFSSGRNSVRMRHLAARPAVSATHLPGEELAVTVHGRAELFELRDPAAAELRQAMLDWYVPRQGPEFETWLDALDAVAARIEPEKMFTFSDGKLGLSGSGRESHAGEALGLGPEPGGGGGVAGAARRPDRGRGPDQAEPPARTVVAAVDRPGVGRRVQQRLGARPDLLRRQDGKSEAGGRSR